MQNDVIRLTKVIERVYFKGEFYPNGIFSESYMWLKENAFSELQLIKHRYPNRYGTQRDKYIDEMIQTVDKLRNQNMEIK